MITIINFHSAAKRYLKRKKNLTNDDKEKFKERIVRNNFFLGVLLITFISFVGAVSIMYLIVGIVAQFK